MNVSGSRDKTSYISVRTCQTHSIIRNFQSYLATGSAKIPYIVCVKTSKPDPTSTRKLSSMWFKAHSRGFELFVYWIFSEIGSKKLQPQENYPKDKMLKIICWMGHLCVRDHLDSNPIWKIPRRIVSFQERKLTYFNTFTFLSFFFLFDPTLVVFTRLFRCAFFLLTPVMSNTKHEEVKITRRSLRDWKSTEHKSGPDSLVFTRQTKMAARIGFAGEVNWFKIFGFLVQSNQNGIERWERK